jgi:hypothetical protein
VLYSDSIRREKFIERDILTVAAAVSVDSVTAVVVAAFVSSVAIVCGLRQSFQSRRL